MEDNWILSEPFRAHMYICCFETDGGSQVSMCKHMHVSLGINSTTTISHGNRYIQKLLDLDPYTGHSKCPSDGLNQTTFLSM